MLRALKFAAYAAAPNALSAALVLRSGTRRPGCPRTSLQPPGWVFGVVWPILYVALGVAIAILADRHKAGQVVALVGLVVLLNAWWLAFGTTCRPVPALAAICVIALYAVAVARSAYKVNKVSGALIAPLVAWLSFATVLSVQQVLLSEGMIKGA